MMQLALADWVFAVAAWVLLVVSFVAAVWALFWDRSRGRRRCPKCWYDMGGVPGLVCPECGRDAGREGRLLKTQRRWKVALAASGLLILLLAFDRREVAEHGWPAAVPTTVLLLGIKWLDVPSLEGPYVAMDLEQPLRPRQRLFLELLVRRSESGLMYWWQRNWLINRCAAGDSRRPQGSAAWREAYVPTLQALARNADLARLSRREQDLAMNYNPLLRPALLPERQLRQVREAQVIAGLHTRSHWPVDVPIRVAISMPQGMGPGIRQVFVVARLPDAAAIQHQPGCSSRR